MTGASITRAVDLPRRGPLPLVVKLQVAGEVLVAYCRVHVLLRRLNVAKTVSRLRRQPGSATQITTADFVTAARLGQAVHRLLHQLPFDSRCLVRSLVLTHMLERRGIPSRIVIGVRPGEQFLAHAWVEVTGVAVLPAGDRSVTFEPVGEL